MLFSRNVKVNGRRTSMRLEGEIWEALEEISERENLTINELCSQIDNMRDSREEWVFPDGYETYDDVYVGKDY